jgi:hypothetical protein
LICRERPDKRRQMVETVAWRIRRCATRGRKRVKRLLVRADFLASRARRPARNVRALELGHPEAVSWTNEIGGRAPRLSGGSSGLTAKLRIILRPWPRRANLDAGLSLNSSERRRLRPLRRLCASNRAYCVSQAALRKKRPPRGGPSSSQIVVQSGDGQNPRLAAPNSPVTESREA